LVFFDLRFLIGGDGVIKIITKEVLRRFLLVVVVLVVVVVVVRGSGRRETREEESTEGVNLGHLCFWLLEQKKKQVGFFLVKKGMEGRGIREIESKLVRCVILKSRMG